MHRVRGQSKVIGNYGYLEKYHDNFYRLIVMKVPIRSDMYNGKRGSKDMNDEKLENNISRARRNIFQYAMCNEFEYFITLTLDKEKADRYDLDQWAKDLGEWIRNKQKKNLAYKSEKVEYLLIPETHKDNAWHIHGLIRGLPENRLRIFEENEVLPDRMRKMILSGRELKEWSHYTHRFGWNSLERIRDRDSVAKYITKYLTKDISEIKNRKNKKLYYHTRGLKKPIRTYEGTIPASMIPSSSQNFYENDYMKLYDLTADQIPRI